MSGFGAGAGAGGDHHSGDFTSVVDMLESELVWDNSSNAGDTTAAWPPLYLNSSAGEISTNTIINNPYNNNNNINNNTHNPINPHNPNNNNNPHNPNINPHNINNNNNNPNMYSNPNNNNPNTYDNSNSNSNSSEASKRKRGEVDSPSDNVEWEEYNYAHRLYFPLYDQNHCELTGTFDLNINVDKLGNRDSYSPADDAYILYRLNQFCVECKLNGTLEHYTPTLQPERSLYIESASGLLVPVNSLYCHIYAIKQPRAGRTNIEEQAEQVAELIQIEGTNRKKEQKVPAPVLIKAGGASYPKLQFKSATANNGRVTMSQPNPNQEYYRIVASLIAFYTPEGGVLINNNNNNNGNPEQTFHFVLSKISPPLIVRGQNPGKYKDSPSSTSSPEDKSQKGSGNPSPTGDNWNFNIVDQSLTTYAKVGINTSTPHEALSVHGNLFVTGDILKPSDVRVKANFQEVDTSKQLENIEKLKLYDYELTDSGAKERGIIAQELQQVLPSAVRVVGSLRLRDNTRVPNLLVVNDRALLIENIGATQQLGHSVKNNQEFAGELADRVDKLIEAENQESQSVRTVFQSIIDFMLSEHYTSVDPRDYCCYCYGSIIGLGPAWTLYVLGWLMMPFLWIFSMCYITSDKKVRRVAGLASLFSLAAYILWTVAICLWSPTPYKVVLIVDLAVAPALGFIGLVVLIANWKIRKAKKKKDNLNALQKLKKALVANPEENV